MVNPNYFFYDPINKRKSDDMKKLIDKTDIEFKQLLKEIKNDPIYKQMGFVVPEYVSVAGDFPEQTFGNYIPNLTSTENQGIKKDDYANITSTPSLTSTPKPTFTPGPTQTPASTSTPGPSRTPASTLTPGPSRTPKPTFTPGPTQTPVSTLTPGPSRTPASTLTPGPSRTPASTLTPGPSRIPASTLTPGPSRTPASTLTPGPSRTPVPILTTSIKTPPPAVHENDPHQSYRPAPNAPIFTYQKIIPRTDVPVPILTTSIKTPPPAVHENDPHQTNPPAPNAPIFTYQKIIPRTDVPVPILTTSIKTPPPAVHENDPHQTNPPAPTEGPAPIFTRQKIRPRTDGPSQANKSAVADSQFKNAMLEKTNELRTLHSCPSLVWDINISKGCQQWADKLCDAKCNVMKHDEREKENQVPLSGQQFRKIGMNKWAARPLGQQDVDMTEGENIYTSSASYFIQVGSELANLSALAWWSEIKDYDFTTHGIKAASIQKAIDEGKNAPQIGHFTQLVWKETKKMGAAYKVSNDGKSVIVVARYTPVGNIQGRPEVKDGKIVMIETKTQKQEGDQLVTYISSTSKQLTKNELYKSHVPVIPELKWKPYM
jgi:uncharacterized protein YkwD